MNAKYYPWLIGLLTLAVVLTFLYPFPGWLFLLSWGLLGIVCYFALIDSLNRAGMTLSEKKVERIPFTIGVTFASIFIAITVAFITLIWIMKNLIF